MHPAAGGDHPCTLDLRFRREDAGEEPTYTDRSDRRFPRVPHDDPAEELRRQEARKARSASKRASKAVTPVAADARDAAVRVRRRDPRLGRAQGGDRGRLGGAARSSRRQDWAAPQLDTAKDWAAPKVEPAVDKVKADVLPAVAGAIATALAATEPQRAEVADRGGAALAALQGRGHPPKPKKHRAAQARPARRRCSAPAGPAGRRGWPAATTRWTRGRPRPRWRPRRHAGRQRHRRRHLVGSDRRRPRPPTTRPVPARTRRSPTPPTSRPTSTCHDHRAGHAGPGQEGLRRRRQGHAQARPEGHQHQLTTPHSARREARPASGR